MSSLRPPRKVELPPWREPPKDDSGRELDPCSLFIGNVPFAMPEEEMYEWLQYFHAEHGVAKLKMNHKSAGQPSSCIATYSTAQQAELALPRIHGSWTTCTPTHSNRFEARIRIGSWVCIVFQIAC